jgi:hypothetical protein
LDAGRLRYVLCAHHGAPPRLGLFSGGTPAVHHASDGWRRGQGHRAAPRDLYKRRRGRAGPESCRHWLSPTRTS